MSGWVDAGASTTDDAIDPPVAVALEPAQPPVAPTPDPLHEGGITRAEALDDEPLTGGRNGAAAGFGSVATSTPLTPHRATAPRPLNALSARVLRVTARRSE
jgi:hypothetical protein